MHPDGKAHGGTALIIRSSIRHHDIDRYQEEHIQATSVIVEDWSGSITISAIYSPPKHTIKNEQYVTFFKTLENRFIAVGDYNAKHTHWGSRLIQPKGRELLKAIEIMILSTV